MLPGELVGPSGVGASGDGVGVGVGVFELTGGVVGLGLESSPPPQLVNRAAANRQSKEYFIGDKLISISITTQRGNTGVILICVTRAYWAVASVFTF